jgi:hypothetical protein
VLLASLLFLFVTQQAPACKDVEVCRAEALIAHARKDYEAFHDLAWAAYGKGRANDTELMLLVARAQSVSGRPGDALVMLERIAALGGTTDALTSDDFVKVRALPRWPDVEARLSAAGAKVPTSPDDTSKAGLKPAARKPDEPGPEDRKPDDRKKEDPKKEEPKKDEPKLPARKKEDPKPPDPGSAEAPRPPRKAGAPLKFSTVLSPSALAYDAVSRRFIIADRAARRVAVIDENTGQVSTLVGVQGALGDVGGIAIDAKQGDLWVVSAGPTGPTLHKMQLISGRLLRTVPLSDIKEHIVGVTFVADSGLVAADAAGTLWRVASSGKTEKIGAFEYVPRALAADPLGRIYVSAGGPRLARYSVGAGLRRIGVVEMDEGLPTDMPFVVSAGRLHVVVRENGEYEIRSMRIK